MKTSTIAIMILSVLSLSVGVIAATHCDDSHAEDTYHGKCGDNVDYAFDKDTGKLTVSGKGVMYPYKDEDGHRAPWYGYRDEIKSLTIEKGITHIGDYAFHRCHFMTSAEIPDTVTVIGDTAFGSCFSLRPLVLPNSVTEIKNGAFAHCYSLDTVRIPDSVKVLGDWSLYNCRSLQHLHIGDGVEVIGTNALSSGDTADLKTIYIGKSLKTVKIDAFRDIKFFDKEGRVIDATPGNLAGKTFSGSSYRMVSVEKYRVYYKVDGETVHSDVLIGSAWHGLREKFVKPGCTVSDWESKETDISYGRFYLENKDVTINASTVGYDVVFMNGDEVFDKRSLEPGAVITAPAGKPTKESTPGHSYAFSGWEGFVVGTKVTGPVTFKATFAETVNKYTVRFVNGDQVTEKEMEFGTVITVPAGKPTKESTPRYSYQFAGWNGFREGMTVSGNHTFAAEFTKTVNEYTIRFVNGDSEISKATLKFGEIIKAPSEKPAREKDIQYTYAFAGWKGFREGMTVTGDRTFTAEFTKTVNEYTIRFVNGDSEISKATLKFGETIKVPSEKPVKDRDSRYSYSFSGWKGFSDGMTVTGDAVFGALFEKSVIPYTVKFVNGDRDFSVTVLGYGDPVTAPTGRPVGEKDAQFTYTFSGWKDFREGMTVSGDHTFAAEFTKTVNRYTVKFVNGSQVTEEEMEFGKTITAPGGVPSREKNVQYTYVFSGWGGFREGMTVTGNAVFFAEFTKTVNRYTVKFVNGDSTVDEKELEFGTAITAPGGVPSREKNVQYTYVFSHWKGFSDGTKVTGDAVFTAEFTEKTNQYTIVFRNGDKEYARAVLDYGAPISAPVKVPTKENDSGFGYRFVEWKGTSDGTVVRGDAVFDAVFEKVPLVSEKKEGYQNLLLLSAVITALAICIAVFATLRGSGSKA